MIILPDGKIECAFHEGFNKEKDKFVKAFLEEKTDAFSEIGYSRNSYSPSGNKSYPKINYNDFTKDENYYIQKVNKAILGYNYGVENLVRDLRNGGSDDYIIINKIFNEQINSGNTRAKKVLEEIMKKAGLE